MMKITGVGQLFDLALKLILILLLSFACLRANAINDMGEFRVPAVPVTTSEPDKPKVNADNPLTKTMNAAINAFMNMFSSGPSLIDIGNKMVYALCLGSVVIIGLRVIGNALDLPGAIAEVVKLSAVAYLALSAIQPMAVSTYFFGSDVSLGNFIADGFLKLAGVAGNQSIIPNAAQAFVNAIKVLWAMPVIPEHIEGWSAFFWLVQNGDFYLVCQALKVLASLGLMVAGVVTLGHLLVAMVQIKLTIYLTPILVPWILFKPMNSFFMGWLKSLINAGLLLFVGNLFAAAGTGFLNAMKSALPTAAALTDGRLYTLTSVGSVYLAVLFGTVLFILMAMKLDKLASSVISGSSVGGFSLHDMKHAIKPATSAVAGAAVGAAVAMKAAGGHSAGKAAMQSAAKAHTASGGQGAPTPAQNKQAYEDGRDKWNTYKRGGGSNGGALRAAQKAGAAVTTLKPPADLKSSGGGAAPSGNFSGG